MLCNTFCGAVAVLGGLTLYSPVAAQSRNVEAVAVCEAQRAPFVQIRKRNNEQLAGRTVVGILGGVVAGAGIGAAATADQSADTQRQAMVVGAVIGAIAGGVDQYLDAKRQITQDNRELSRMIDADARGHAGRVNALIAAINATGDCRQTQISTWEQRLIATRSEFAQREQARAAALSAAPDDRARRTVERENRRAAQADGRILQQMGEEERMIRAAIADDKKLFEDVLQYFDSDIMAMAEAQARVEGTSPASLRGPAEAYTVQVIPPAILASASAFQSSGSGFGSSGSAFGGPAPAPSAARVAPQPPAAAPPRAGRGAARPAAAAPPPPWQAQIVRPQMRAANGHQAALIAQRDAAASASATTQSSQARLQLALQRGAEIRVGS